MYFIEIAYSHVIPSVSSIIYIIIIYVSVDIVNLEFRELLILSVIVGQLVRHFYTKDFTWNGNESAKFGNGRKVY